MCMLTSLSWGDTQPVSLKNKKREDKMRKMPGSFRKKFFMSQKCWACVLKEQCGSTWFVDFHCWQSKLTGQFLKIYSLKFDEIMSTSHFSPWRLKINFEQRTFVTQSSFSWKLFSLKILKTVFLFTVWGHFNSQEKLKTMFPQNFWETNKEHYGMLWYFLEWSIVMS